jgi:Holliday junction DNA helicase RuvA
LTGEKKVYSFLRGVVESATPTEVVLDVGGVGYRLLVPLSTYSVLPGGKGEVKLLTHLYVRDAIMDLYGFATQEERAAFVLLLGVSGVGPRVAQAILSTLSVTDIHRAILESDVAAFTKVKGVGKRTGQRIILDLKSKIGTDDGDIGELLGEDGSVSQSDVIDALMALGCTQAQARKAANKAATEMPADTPVEERLKFALRHI